MTTKRRKPVPQPPRWYWWQNDCCWWWCRNRTNCGNCKVLKGAVAEQRSKKRTKGDKYE